MGLSKEVIQVREEAIFSFSPVHLDRLKQRALQLHARSVQTIREVTDYKEDLVNALKRKMAVELREAAELFESLERSFRQGDTVAIIPLERTEAQHEVYLMAAFVGLVDSENRDKYKIVEKDPFLRDFYVKVIGKTPQEVRGMFPRVSGLVVKELISSVFTQERSYISLSGAMQSFLRDGIAIGLRTKTYPVHATAK